MLLLGISCVDQHYKGGGVNVKKETFHAVYSEANEADKRHVDNTSPR